ncbi:hypothetical protein WA026_017785 [Henosepilachna vigintioctopunctata]|uniref:Carboxypeptidase n=1 Tax=Henosepilachna vigintioctopunctata TaxID=420089 RepID=A0AAW1U9W0_9CUCU
MRILSICSLLVLWVHLSSCRLGPWGTRHVKNIPIAADEDPGNPLILTSYLKYGRIQEARQSSRVPPKYFLGVESFSGYLTVNETYNSNSFFWFIPSTDVNYTEAPVLLWLQGGPGADSIYAAFTENGPFEMIDETHLKRRDVSWTSTHSVLYIDNPVGTGFSFTNGRWCTSEEEIGEDLYNALIQFFQLFPELQKNDFFITGESYAGKYIPAVAYTIHKRNPDAELKINLKGISMGNGLSDPANQLNYGDYLFQIGLIDYNVRAVMKELEKQAVDLINEEKYEDAFIIFDKLLNGDLTEGPTVFKNATGFDNYYNYLHSKASDDSQYSVFVQQNHIRQALHVGDKSFLTDKEVENSLRADMVKSVAPWVSELLDHYKVLIYNGQLDIIVAYPLTINYLSRLNFSAANEYKVAKRNQWIVNNEIAGYVKEAGNLVEVLVRNAGHMVPTDQPEWALDLISKFVRNIPLH